MARFFRRGVSRVYFLPAVANKNQPTTSEVTAGQEMTASLFEVAGFSYQNAPIATPDWGDNFTSNVPGEDTAAQSQLHFYEDKTTNPLRATLAKGVTGYVLIFWSGTAGGTPAVGDKCETWPVISTGPVREYATGNEAAKWRVDFAITSRPGVDASM